MTAMGERKRLYRLTYPDSAPRGSRLQTGVVERWLTDVQADRLVKAAERPGFRLSSVELAPDQDSEG